LPMPSGLTDPFLSFGHPIKKITFYDLGKYKEEEANINRIYRYQIQ
jgi:hypothetical protein